MSQNWVQDMAVMHAKFDVNKAVENMSPEVLKEFLKFRINFLQEELDEMKKADNADDVVDALIDLCVVAIGTLDLYKVDAHLAWDRVFTANIAKEVGVKEERPNPHGLPDLVKPQGWKAPTHEDNVGLLEKTFD